MGIACVGLVALFPQEGGMMMWDEQIFARFMADRWQAHTKAPAQVAGCALTTLAQVQLTEAQLIELSALAGHAYGEHLGDWDGGLAYYAAVDLRYCMQTEVCRARLARQRAILHKARDSGFDLSAFALDDRYYIATLAVPAAILHGDVAAGEAICAEARHYLTALGESPDAMRLMAVMTANLCCDLVERYHLSAAQQVFLVALTEDSERRWRQIGDAADWERAAFRRRQVETVLLRPAGYGSGRYPRAVSIAP